VSLYADQWYNCLFYILS